MCVAVFCVLIYKEIKTVATIGDRRPCMNSARHTGSTSRTFPYLLTTDTETVSKLTNPHVHTDQDDVWDVRHFQRGFRRDWRLYCLVVSLYPSKFIINKEMSELISPKQTGNCSEDKFSDCYGITAWVQPRPRAYF